jgi:hypothetical protein
MMGLEKKFFINQTSLYYKLTIFTKQKNYTNRTEKGTSTCCEDASGLDGWYMLDAKTKLSFKSVSTGQAKRNGTDDPELKTWLFLRFNLGKSKVWRNVHYWD